MFTSFVALNVIDSPSTLIEIIGFCRFYFDFSMTYVGAGMICSHLVNLSLLLGAILSWGIMWPLIAGLKGDWFPATLPESSMRSVNGYKVHKIRRFRLQSSVEFLSVFSIVEITKVTLTISLLFRFLFLLL